MKQIESDFCSLFILDIGESIDDKNLAMVRQNEDKISYILSLGNLYQYKNIGGIDVVAACQEKLELVNKLFKNELYESNTTYVLSNQYPKIEYNTMKEIIRFLYEGFKKYNCESMVYLLFNKNTNHWTYLIPIQYDLSRTSVSYMDLCNSDKNKKLELIKNNKEAYDLHKSSLEYYSKLLDEGYVVAGTVHSHSNFSAFHSSVDDNDEMGFDGLHITVGNLNTQLSFSARYMLSGSEFKVEMKDIVKNFKNNIDIHNILFDVSYLEYLRNDINVPTRAINLLDNKIGTRWYDLPYRFDHIPNHKFNHTHDYSIESANLSSDDGWDDEDIEDLILHEDDAIRLLNTETGNVVYVHNDDYRSSPNMFVNFTPISKGPVTI